MRKLRISVCRRQIVRNFSIKIERNYEDAINALNSLQTNFATLENIRAQGTRKASALALPEMIEWTRRIGYRPQDLDALRIIHVTGTKGKGSTCAFTASILNEYSDSLPKIGLYTSPHLKSVRERIRINQHPISAELFTKYFFEVWDRLQETKSDIDLFPDMAGPAVRPVYFRYLTLLSFHVFLSEKVDSAVYEVGIGGEYDSTNIIVHPTAVGISSIGIDHTRVLGHTLSEIAWNKSGIMKPGTKAFSVNQKPEAWNVLSDRAFEKNVPLVKVEILSALDQVPLGIDGEYQKINASLAIALAKEHLLRLNVPTELDRLDESHLPAKFVKGIENARWPGRCQTLLDKPTNGQVEFLLDGAHTEDSIAVAANWFATKAKNKATKKVLLFNQQTRDASALVNRMHSILGADVNFDEVIFCTNTVWKKQSARVAAELTSINVSDSDVQNLVVQKQLAETWARIDGRSKRTIFPSVEEAVQYVRELVASPVESEGNSKVAVQVFATGSLHLVGALLVLLEDE
ncbi:Mur ligase [Lipomyces oligophaga]|uniref:Mur ligase n=1 Tax=Lipomyces oligophaga TaxID=45792 RepID=UPI0034CDA193